MNKWYNEASTDKSVIISSRIRLARNVKKYPFSRFLEGEQAKKMLQEAIGTIKNERSILANRFEYIALEEKSEIEKRMLLERHIISPELMKDSKNKGVLVQDDEAVSIMLNEEDHIRIQTIFAFEKIDEAWQLADNIDNLIEESIEYAFDKDFGYLTACPTNTGTGLRASFMLHLPILEQTGQLKNIIQALSKFGMTVRGIYGEGTEPLGSIYQISNQITMGKTEEETIEALKNVTNQIIEKETYLRDNAFNLRKLELTDEIYRSYGILTNCRKISGKEAMSLLSQVRLGFLAGVLQAETPKLNIYNIMMNIQAGNLQKVVGQELDEKARDIARAEYIRANLSKIN